MKTRKLGTISLDSFNSRLLHIKIIYDDNYKPIEVLGFIGDSKVAAYRWQIPQIKKKYKRSLNRKALPPRIRRIGGNPRGRRFSPDRKQPRRR